MNAMQKSLLGFAAALCFTGAQADTLYTAGNTGQMESPYSFDAGFNAVAGAGSVNVQLQGYNTLDGNNYYVDVFHVSLNGSEVFTGTFGLGGGGGDLVVLAPEATVSNHHDGVVDFAIPVNLVDGQNTVTFAYSSPTSFDGTNRYGPEGLDNEGWGLNSTEITGNAVPAVPEPETYALLLAGLGAVGFVARRRSAAR